MSSRYYPLFQKGNPQLRIFLPNFWMKLVRSKEPLPPNVVLFQTSIEMTKYDVKNYLEKIYNVPVVEVKTTIKMGATRRNGVPIQNVVRDDDYKEALVTLPKDHIFEFPSITKEVGLQELKNLKKVKDNYMKQREITRSNHRLGIPKWFFS